MCKVVVNPHKIKVCLENDQRNNSDILERMEKLGILLLKNHGNHVALVGKWLEKRIRNGLEFSDFQSVGTQILV